MNALTLPASTLPAPRAVLADRIRAADALLVGGGAAVIGLSAQVAVPVPGSPVPVTGQTLAVFLCAAALGARRGTAAVVTYVLAGLAGVPWFAGATAGLTPATFGYLLGMVAAAAVVGGLARRGGDRTPWRVIPVMLLGNVVVYAAGVSWLAAYLGVTAAVHAGLTPFLIGDAIKIVLAAGLLPAAWRFSSARPR